MSEFSGDWFFAGLLAGVIFGAVLVAWAVEYIGRPYRTRNADATVDSCKDNQ